MGWLILIFPIWNFYKWRWTDIAAAVIKKFEFVDARGNPLDFLKTSRKRFAKSVARKFQREGFNASRKMHWHFSMNIFQPDPKEKEMHDDYGRT